MTSLPAIGTMELYETVDKAAEQITSILKLINVGYSPNCDVEPNNQTLESVFFMLEDDAAEILKIIQEFPEKNKIKLPDYKGWMVEEIDLIMEDLINVMGVLGDCYSKPTGMPFSNKILSAIITEAISDIAGVVNTVEDYCKEIKQEFYTNEIEPKALNTKGVS